MVEQTFEQLMLISIGVSEYQEQLGFTTVPSACFDTITVSNYFAKQGFKTQILNNPSKEEALSKLKLIRQQVYDIHAVNPATLTFVIVYFTGYATESNHAIFGDGETLDLSTSLASYMDVQNSQVLLFQDCMSLSGDFGDIHCTHNSYKQTAVFRSLFRSQTLDRFLRYKTNAMITFRLLLTQLDPIIKQRNATINSSQLHLYVQEKEFETFMMKYLTFSQNVCACEIRLMILRDFQVKLQTYIKEIFKEQEQPKLLNSIKADIITNQFCEIADLIDVNFDRSEAYGFADIKIPFGRIHMNFTLVHNEDRCAILSISSTKKEIVGSFSLQGSGVSDQKIIKCQQAYQKSEIFICTNKDRLIKLKIDMNGNLFYSDTYKLSNLKEKTEIQTFCECDGHFVFGMSDGTIQFYDMLSSTYFKFSQEIQVYYYYTLFSDMILKRCMKNWNKWDAEQNYQLFICGRLNQEKIKFWNQVPRCFEIESEYNKKQSFTAEKTSMYITISLSKKNSSLFKLTSNIKEMHSTNVYSLYDAGSSVYARGQNRCLHHQIGINQCKNSTGFAHKQYEEQTINEQMSSTMVTCKNLKDQLIAYTNQKKRIILFNVEKALRFTIYESAYSDLIFAGKIVWFQTDRFVALVQGDQNLQLAEFIIDKELISCINSL